MANKIDLQPQVLDLSLYAGDGVSFRLVCTDPDDAPLNVEGATEAQIRVDRTVGSEALVDFTTDMTGAPDGIIGLSLTGEQTQALLEDPSTSKGKFTGVWDIQWTPPGEQPRTLCQGKVECYADVTR